MGFHPLAVTPRSPTNAMRSLEPYTWSIGIARANSLENLEGSIGSEPLITNLDFGKYQGEFVADPFAIYRGGSWFVFFELRTHRSPKAVIAGSMSNDLVNWTPLGVVLETKRHLSYPFVFEHHGEVYMMPECKRGRRVDIYRACNFPYEWRLEKSILRGKYMDASMVYRNGRYWIFAGWHSYWLRLFHASHPLGPWFPHAFPFIRRYSRLASRPGGRPFVFKDKLYRLGQDCRVHYGHQLRAWEVTKLSRLWYSERPAFEKPIFAPNGIESHWCGHSMHHADIHVDASDSMLAFIDGRNGCEKSPLSR